MAAPRGHILQAGESAYTDELAKLAEPQAPSPRFREPGGFLRALVLDGVAG